MPAPPVAASPPSLPGGARRVTSAWPRQLPLFQACRAAQVALLVPRTPGRSVLNEIRPQSLSEEVKSQELWNRLPFGEIIPRKEGARVGSHGVAHQPVQPRCPPLGFRGAAFRSQRELLLNPIPRAGNDNGREQDERHSPGADGENGKKGEGWRGVASGQSGGPRAPGEPGPRRGAERRGQGRALPPPPAHRDQNRAHSLGAGLPRPPMPPPPPHTPRPRGCLQDFPHSSKETLFPQPTPHRPAPAPQS